jgi:hypothetical protein
MAAKFYGIVINAALYTPSTPIELTVANQSALSTYLNGLGFGNFSVLITSTTCNILVLQTEHNITSFATIEPDMVYNFASSNCVNLESDDDYYCDYQLNTTSDPSDTFVGIVVDSVLYKPITPILASDVAAVQAYLTSVNLGFINYQNQGGIYMIATLTPQNISYIILNKAGVDTIFTFTQSNCHIPVIGCMDPLADNYNPQAEISDGSCQYGQLTYGCKDPLAMNYDPLADRSDDSCLYEPLSDLQRLECCAADLGYQLALNELHGKSNCECCWAKLDFVLSTIDAINNYVSPTERDQVTTIPGFVAKSTLPFADFDDFGVLTSVIIVDGQVVGVLPLDNYADINELLDAMVLVITGFNASHETDSTDLVIETINPDEDANGLIVEIVINPEFQLTSTTEKTDRSLRQGIQINDPNSALYGKTIIATRSATAYYLELFENGLPSDTVLVNPAVGAYSLVHNPVTDTLLTGAYLGNGNVSVFSNTLADTASVNISGITGTGWAVYNNSNGCLYFASDSINRIAKIDSDGNQTLITGLIDVFRIAVDGNGDIWSIGIAANSLYKISGTDDSVTQIVVTGEVATDLCYYPGDGTAGTERMLITFSTPGVLRTYNLDGTVDNATLYSLSVVSAVIYSSIFNVIFVANATTTRIIDLSGNLIKSIAEGVYQFLEDIEYKKVIGLFTVSGSPAKGTVKYFNLGNDGEFSIDDALEDSVPEQIIETKDPNPYFCQTYDELETMKARAFSLCTGCCSDDQSSVNDAIYKN